MNATSSRYCADDNPKIVTRIYDWDGRKIQIDLCKLHCKDPDFSNFISESEVQYRQQKDLQ